MAALSATGGMYFEEYEVGQTIITEGRTITEADVVNFAGVSGDFNPMHTDAAYAEKTPFGKRVAHGALVLAVATGLAYRMRFMEGTVLAFRSINEWKFSAPVFLGDTIHCEVEVSETKPASRLGGGVVTFNVKVLNQQGESVQRGSWSVIIASRPSAEA